MAEAVISAAVRMLGNLLVEEGKSLHGVKEQAGLLLAELKQMQWFLKDVDQRQRDQNDRFVDWVSQFTDLACEAQNLIERYEIKIQSGKERGVAGKVKRCVCLLEEYSILHQIGSDMEKLGKSISLLTTRFGSYGIRAIMENEGGSSSRIQYQLRRNYSCIVEEEPVGIEDQVEMLARQLISDNYKLVSICGMGGLGKTTLARNVYHHPDVRRNFNVFAWICVSQQWQKRDLLKDLVTELMRDKKEVVRDWRDQDLVRELFEFQQNNKCLVVIDDMWSEEAWECIKYSFLIREDGNKVLLTTRNREIAAHIDADGFSYEPPPLKEEYSWELFARIFRHTRDRDETMIQRMKELGKEMIKHCGGLPLAILVLRGILATKRSLEDWKKVHEDIKPYLRDGDKIGQDRKGLHSILELSYYDLPRRLKDCFLYLSRYLENDYIDTETLYRMWMAEGIISMEDQIGDETMMEVAERNLRELSKRYMMVVRFGSYRLHDLMRDLCLQKAKEENFLKLINCRRRGNKTDQVVDSSISNFLSNKGISYRRLAIHLLPEDVKRFVPPENESTQQLTSFSLSVIGNFWKGEASERTLKLVFGRYKMLKVLSIMRVYFGDEKKVSVPKSIGNLVLLRYLSLKDSGFHSVPSSISKLSYLETLDLRSISIRRISNAIRKLRRLKYLYLPKVELISKVRLDGLHNLETLENFHSKNNDVKVLSTLTNLRSLTAFVSDHLEDLEEFLNQVNQLRHLGCLWIYCGRIRKLPEYQPCFLPNLHELLLVGTEMKEDPMKTLEKLPNLRRLTLDEKSFIGDEMTCHENGFLQLKSLTFRCLEDLNNLWIEKGAMPNISWLSIQYCEKLKMIPEGLRFTSTLEVLEIVGMPKEFKAGLQVKDGQEGEDFDKIRQVPYICFWG